MTETISKAVARKQEQAPGVGAVLKRMEPEFRRALPDSIPPERFTRLALTAFNSNPDLRRCSTESFLGALLTCAQLGLEPNTPTGEAYLIPYGTVCTFVPGYQGLAKLAWQSGQVEEMYAEPVFERDTFSYRLGLHRDLVHEPFTGGDRGSFVGVYAVVKMKGGGVAFDFMTAEQLEEHRRRYSKQRGKSPWDEGYWMHRKTVLKQVLKLVPKSTMVALGRALSNDGAVRTDLTVSAIDLITDDDYADAEVVDEETGEITEASA